MTASAASAPARVNQTGSLRIAPGQLYETQPQHTSIGVVNIIGATTGQALFATEY